MLYLSMKTKKTLTECLEASADKKILLLGREGLFNTKEIERFLKKYKIVLTSDYVNDIAAVIEHHMLNPLEEDVFNTAYDNGMPLYKLSALEKLISASLNDDEILMGIKLANDQGRVFRLLGNESIREALFVKLLSLYEWDDEEEDSCEDRDVIIYTLRRYIDIKPNEQDLLYSYLTLRRLATEATDPRLLQALIGFPNFEFMVRGKEKITLRETIARNEYVDEEVISKLISLRDRKVDVALACNHAVGLPLLKKLLEKSDAKINEALATNTKVDNETFSALLAKEDKAVQLLLLSQPIDRERLVLIDAQKADETLMATLGANERLQSEVTDALLQRENEALLCHLAANETLSASQLEDLYAKGIRSTFVHLAANPSMPAKLLEMFFADYDEDAIRIALAHNKSTPVQILRTLFERDVFEIHKSMASNSSVPMALLDILKVDTRLQNELSQNEIFVKAYETVLDYDKKAVQF